MREFANATGQDYDGLIKSAKLLKKEQAIMQQMGSLFGGEEDADMLQQFVAAQAQFKDGEYVIDLGAGDVAVDELSADEIKILRSQQENASKSEKEVALSQLGALEAIHLTLDKGLKVMEFDAADTFAPLLKDLTADAADMVEGVVGDIYGEIKDLAKAGLTDMLGAGDGEALTQAITDLTIKISDYVEIQNDSGVSVGLETKTKILPGAAVSDFDDWWAQGLDKLKAELLGESNGVDDYFTSGKVNIIQDGKPSVTTSPSDLVMAIDRQKIESSVGGMERTMPDMTSMQRSESLTNQSNKVEGKFNITVDGTSHIIVDGKNLKVPLRDMFNDDELISIVKDKLNKSSLLTMGGSDYERGHSSRKSA